MSTHLSSKSGNWHQIDDVHWDHSNGPRSVSKKAGIFTSQAQNHGRNAI